MHTPQGENGFTDTDLPLASVLAGNENPGKAAAHEATAPQQQPLEHTGVEEKVSSDGETLIGEDKGMKGIRLYLIIASLTLTIFLAALDQTVVSTAVPTIVADFQSPGGYGWIGTAYVLSQTAFSPIWGQAADVLGRRFCIFFVIIVFLIGTALCGSAQSLPWLIAARAIQGGGGGGIFSMNNIVLSDIVSVRERSKYMGITGIAWAGAAGPLIGGVLTTKVSWRWAFYINLPIGGIVLPILYFLLRYPAPPKESLRQTVQKFDFAGIATIFGATLLSLFALESGGVTFPWKSAVIISLFCISGCLLALFIWIETRVTYPILPPGLLKSRTVAMAMITGFFHYCCYLAFAYYLPLYFQGVKLQTAIRAGVSMLPYLAAVAFTNFFIGFIVNYTGRYYEPLVIGTAVMCLGAGLCIDFNGSEAKQVGYLLILGLGAGVIFPLPLSPIHAVVKREDVATATSAYVYARAYGATIGVALGAIVFQNTILQYTLPPQFHGLESIKDIPTYSVEEQEVVVQIVQHGCRNMFISFMILGACCFLSSLFIGKHELQKHVKSSVNIRRKHELQKHVKSSVNIRSITRKS